MAYIQNVYKNEVETSSRVISTAYCERLIGRAIINGYSVKRDPEDHNNIVVDFGTNDKKVHHEFIWEPFDWDKEKKLEQKEREERYL